MAFPAKQITTEKSWDDLKLNGEVKTSVQDIINSLRSDNNSSEPHAINKSPGFRALFHGPAKSGKKTTAAFLAKETGRDIYKIDLSQLISKYVGDTEKNLEVLFARAEEKQWILYFDEADELFGKRGENKEPDDKYSNVELSSLLQNIWHYSGLVIITAKKKKQIDEAYMKRFDKVLNFD